jgi:hypothetical protein
LQNWRFDRDDAFEFAFDPGWDMGSAASQS